MSSLNPERQTTYPIHMNLIIPRPFDRHVHLRRDNLLRTVGPHTWGYASGAIIMPNTAPDKITTTARAAEYLREIEEAMRASNISSEHFTPYLTCYLTDTTNPDDVVRGFGDSTWKAVKSYPLGATTNSDEGTSDWERVAPVLVAMEKNGIPLLIHGETPDFSPDLFKQPGKNFRLPSPTRKVVDVFSRERIFLEETLYFIRRQYPRLKIVLEHITTKEAAEFVCNHPNTWATVTPQHLVFNRNDMLGKKLRPDLFCMPILKGECHPLAIQDAITGPHAAKFGAGTDTAPHLPSAKHCEECCAGCFNAIEAPSIYAAVFDQVVGLQSISGAALFENFMSRNLLRDVYGIEPSQQLVRFTNDVPLVVPDSINGRVRVIPMLAGQSMEWSWSHVNE